MSKKELKPIAYFETETKSALGGAAMTLRDYVDWSIARRVQLP